MASLISHYTFVFLLRRLCLSVFCTIYQFIQRAGARRQPLWNCVRKELQAASGLLVLAFSDLTLEVQQQVYCSDGELTLENGPCKRLNVNWLGTKGGASSGLRANPPGVVP